MPRAHLLYQSQLLLCAVQGPRHNSMADTVGQLMRQQGLLLLAMHPALLVCLGEVQCRCAAKQLDQVGCELLFLGGAGTRTQSMPGECSEDQRPLGGCGVARVPSLEPQLPAQGSCAGSVQRAACAGQLLRFWKP